MKDIYGNVGKQSFLFKFSFSEIWYSLSEFNSRKIANIWQIKQDWIRAKKFEVAQINLLCDSFAAVAFVDEGVEVELWFCYLCILGPYKNPQRCQLIHGSTL